MAINPSILLQGRTADAVGALQRGQQLGDTMRNASVRDAILQQQRQMGQQQLQQGQQAIQQGQTQAAQIKGQFFNRLSRGLMALPLEERAGALAKAVPMMEQMGINPQSVLDQDLTDNALKEVVTATEPFMAADASGAPAGVRQFKALADAAGLEPGTEEYNKAALVELGLEPRAGISATERIAQDPELMRRVAALEEQKAESKETGKLGAQARLLPGIRLSIKQAEQEASSRGEALSEYGRAQAAMPGLREVVNKLKTLSDVATYTMGGKVFDSVVKELGFGATKGATARAKMESLVNNQILPLLRDTFGAQFTEREGEQLRKTMLDINAAPEQKKQILDSFIEQKMRDLEMKRERVEDTGQQTSANQESTKPVTRIRLDAEGNIIQ